MFLSRIINWIEEFAPAPDTVDQREVKPRSRTRLAGFLQATHLGNFMAMISFNGFRIIHV
jgi:hypothetical protein